MALGGGAGAKHVGRPQVRANFRPEFVNRVDDFVVFEALRKDEIKHIVRIQVPAPGGLERSGCRASALHS
jgi:ATP-dependent Clp protease ATP-binding subunit ClpA